MSNTGTEHGRAYGAQCCPWGQQEAADAYIAATRGAEYRLRQVTTSFVAKLADAGHKGLDLDDGFVVVVVFVVATAQNVFGGDDLARSILDAIQSLQAFLLGSE